VICFELQCSEALQMAHTTIFPYTIDGVPFWMRYYMDGYAVWAIPVDFPPLPPPPPTIAAICGMLITRRVDRPPAILVAVAAKRTRLRVRIHHRAGTSINLCYRVMGGRGRGGGQRPPSAPPSPSKAAGLAHIARSRHSIVESWRRFCGGP